MERKIIVHVKPNAPETKIISQGDEWKVAVAAKPEDGEANRELIKFLERELKANIKILRGRTSRRKILEILN